MEQPAPLHPLRQWRLAKGMTLQEAADLVGTSRHVWSDWERGRRRPNKHYMPKLKAATGGKLTLDHFFCGQLEDAA